MDLMESKNNRPVAHPEIDLRGILGTAVWMRLAGLTMRNRVDPECAQGAVIADCMDLFSYIAGLNGGQPLLNNKVYLSEKEIAVLQQIRAGSENSG